MIRVWVVVWDFALGPLASWSSADVVLGPHCSCCCFLYFFLKRIGQIQTRARVLLVRSPGPDRNNGTDFHFCSAPRQSGSLVLPHQGAWELQLHQPPCWILTSVVMLSLQICLCPSPVLYSLRFLMCCYKFKWQHLEICPNPIVLAESLVIRPTSLQTSWANHGLAALQGIAAAVAWLAWQQWLQN